MFVDAALCLGVLEVDVFSDEEDAARACCSHTCRALWSTGQLSALAAALVSTGGCDGGSEAVVESVAADAAFACSSQASLLLWSTGHVACCWYLGSAVDMMFGGGIGGEPQSCCWRGLRNMRSMMSCSMAELFFGLPGRSLCR